MKSDLCRIVTSAVTAFTARIIPSREDRRKAAVKRLDDLDKAEREAELGKLSHTFVQRSEFTQQMHRLLDGSNAELDQVAATLQGQREKIAGLRSQLDASQSATEATWGDVKASLTRGHGELHDGLRSARQWARGRVAQMPGPARLDPDE
jgi:hypothetical protein